MMQFDMVAPRWSYPPGRGDHEGPLMAARKTTRARTTGKLDALRRSRPELFVEHREPARDSMLAPPAATLAALKRAQALVDNLESAIVRLRTVDTPPAEREALTRFVDAQYDAMLGGKHLPRARLVFLRAIDSAARLGEGAACVRQLFGAVFPELAAGIAGGDGTIDSAVSAWRQDHAKWERAREALLLFDTEERCPKSESLKRLWFDAGGAEWFGPKG